IILIKHVLFFIHGYVDIQAMTGGHAQKLFPKNPKNIRNCFNCFIVTGGTHIVDDVSDYDIAPMNPPNDEYVSDVDVESDGDSDDDSE
ncbi:hypothetical protein HID58_005476, partial [Brassica napus]